MSVHEIDPEFTGSVSGYVSPELVQMRMPFRIAVSRVEDVTDGKVTCTYYDWRVSLTGKEIARRNVYDDSLPKTRGAAIRQARKVIKDYCECCLSREMNL
jgi:hypothetical protein